MDSGFQLVPLLDSIEIYGCWITMDSGFHALDSEFQSLTLVGFPLVFLSWVLITSSAKMSRQLIVTYISFPDFFSAKKGLSGVRSGVPDIECQRDTIHCSCKLSQHVLNMSNASPLARNR